MHVWDLLSTLKSVHGSCTKSGKFSDIISSTLLCHSRLSWSQVTQTLDILLLSLSLFFFFPYFFFLLFRMDDLYQSSSSLICALSSPFY